MMDAGRATVTRKRARIAVRAGWEYLQVVLVALIAAMVLKTFVVDAVYVPTPSMASTLLPGDFILVNKLIYGAASSRISSHTASFPSFRLPAIRPIERGDILVFEFPERTHPSLAPVRFVKRCAGVAGDRVEIRNGRLYVNGMVSAQGEILSPDAGTLEHTGSIHIPRRGEAILLTGENAEEWSDLISGEGHSLETDDAGRVFVDGKETHTYTIERNYLFVLGDNSRQSYDSRAWGLLPEENVIGQATMIYWSVNPASTVRHIADFFSSVRWDRIGALVR